MQEQIVGSDTSRLDDEILGEKDKLLGHKSLTTCQHKNTSHIFWLS